MTTAVAFLVVPLGAALVGSVILWLISKARRPHVPDFNEQLRAIAPREGTPPQVQSSGIVPFDPSSPKER
jgi:hypothetical protein